MVSKNKSIHEQLDDIRFHIEHHESTIKACQDKIKGLRATITTTREIIKRLKKERKDLIFSTVGIPS